MGGVKKIQAREIGRDLLERLVDILGPASAVARALEQADQHDGPVHFWWSNGLVIVEKIPKERVG